MFQRKVRLLLSTFALAVSSYGQDYASPLDAISAAQQMLSPRVACLVGEGSDIVLENANPYAQCIRDICGEQATTLFNANDNYVKSTEAESEKVFDDYLKNGLDDVFNTVESNALDSLSKLSAEEKSAVTAQMQIDELYREYVENLTGAIIEAFASSGAPIEALPYFEDSAIGEMGTIYPPELVNAFEKKRTLQKLAIAEANASLGNLNRDQLVQVLKREKIADGAWRLPDLLGIERMRLMSKMAQTSNQVPIDSKGGYMSGNEDILLLQNYVDLQVAQELSRSEAEIKEINAGILKDYQESMGELPAPVDMLKDRLSETRAACEASLKSNLGALPTDRDIQIMQQKVEQNRAEIIAKMKRNRLFSDHSLRELTKHLNGVDIRLPPSKKDYARSLGALFGNLKGFSNVVGTKDKVYGALAMIRGADCFSEAKYDTNMAYYFDPNNHQHAHGFVYLDSSAIHDFDAVGAPVMAHELGHAVSIHLQQGKGSVESRSMRRDVMNCLKRGHVSGGFFQKLFGSAPTVFGEEDFADSFAAQVKPTASNLGCSLTKDGAPSSRDLGVLTSVQLNYQSVGNPNWQHSSTVYRMLHFEAATKGRIPNSCSQVMEESGENVNFPTSCWSKVRRDQDQKNSR